MSDPQAATRDETGARIEIGYGLADVTHLLRMAFDQRMRKMGLTTATWRVIAYLSREDGAAPGPPGSVRPRGRG
eukprot:gene42631-57717_t